MARPKTLILLLAFLWVSFMALAQDEGQKPAQPQPSPAPSLAADQATSPFPADSTALEVIKAPKPDYPLEAAAKRLQGRVWIKLLISEADDVESTEIIGGEPVLAKAAEAAMQQWKLKPFIKDDRPVKASRRVPFDFVVKDNFAKGCPAAEAVLLANETPQQLLVPQEFMEGRLVHRVEPEYPMLAREKHVQGDVFLQVIIGEDGKIRDVKALCGRPELVPASIAAIREWRYRPSMLEGNPVPVKTIIKIQFHM